MEQPIDDHAKLKVGVAISTHARPNLLARALFNWATHGLPDVLVVNHDRLGLGVARTKNAGIDALMNAHCDHLFLADDDVWPVAHGWAEHYVNDPAAHLMHCWGKSRFAGMEDTHTIWTWPRGVLLYATRDVVCAVGGMRREFGRWGGEHAEWSRRIHNKGLTAHPFMDVRSARKGVWHCEDYTRSTPSSVPLAVRDDPERTRARHALYDQFRHSDEFVPWR